MFHFILLLLSPTIPENDLPRTAESQKMTYWGLANSNLQQAGRGKATISNVLWFDDARKSTCRSEKRIWWNQLLKGTQDWELFWLRFWNLRYFFVSYVKILRFYKKVFWLGHYWGRYDEKKFWARSKKFLFSFSILDPKQDPMLGFWKFNHLNAPGTTLCVDLGSKCQIFFPLVWD